MVVMTVHDENEAINHGVEIKNVSTKKCLVDKLITSKNLGQLGCVENQCYGSLMGTFGYAQNSIEKPQKLIQAKEFLQEYFEENNQMDEFQARWDAVKEEISYLDRFDLAYDELLFAAKTAWRNTARCVGRGVWKDLTLRDCRHIETVDEMYLNILAHIKESYNQGSIKPMCTVFPERPLNGPDKMRLWNAQLFQFAGYWIDEEADIVLGDRGNIHFTEFCQSLGWRGKGTKFDILPLILSGPDGKPKYYDIPEDLVPRVKIEHPTIHTISKLDLQWYGLPAVSGMMLEVAGLQFPACPFSGWYALSEIATRNFLDEHRYNLRLEIARAMGLDTSCEDNMWRERVNTEISVAVYHSFKSKGVTMVDNHTLNEQFMLHFDQEYKTRGGCPSDWVWIVPPTSSGLTLTFHQEMLNYHLSPSYEYQEPLWTKVDKKKPVEKIKVLRRASSGSFTKKSPKALIFYGTTTGTAKKYANIMQNILDGMFQAKMKPLGTDSFDEIISTSFDNAILLIIASTTGNGEAPFHAIEFKESLIKAKQTGRQIIKGLKFSVFALGSSNYENFCSFGKFCDQSLDEMGGFRIAPLALADDQKSQERSLRIWAKAVGENGCNLLNIALSPDFEAKLPFSLTRASRASWGSLGRIGEMQQETTIDDIKALHGQKLGHVNIMKSVLLEKKRLSERYTMFTIGFPTNPWLKFEHGDHLCIFPENNPALVEEIISVLIDKPAPFDLVAWTEGDIPPSTLSQALTSFLDLESIPTQEVIKILGQFATDEVETKAIEKLHSNAEAYTEWAEMKPDILDFLKLFPSVKVPAASFVASMVKLESRSFSVASLEPKQYLHEDHMIPCTQLVVSMTQYESGYKSRRGACSGFLSRMPIGGTFFTYQESDGHFTMQKLNAPIMILICAGSGIGPCRVLIQHRARLGKDAETYLYFGCRDEEENLFADETANAGVTRINAFSRVGDQKVYVQNLLERDQDFIYDAICNKKASIYICGKTTFGVDVRQCLIGIFKAKENQGGKDDGLEYYKGLALYDQLVSSGSLIEQSFG